MAWLMLALVALARAAGSTAGVERISRHDPLEDSRGNKATPRTTSWTRTTTELVFGTMPGLAEYAEIALPLAVHGTFTYAIPPELRDGVRLGSRVEVPFGTKRSTGFVVALADTAPADKAAKIKPLRALLDDEEPALVPEIIDLLR